MNVKLLALISASMVALSGCELDPEANTDNNNDRDETKPSITSVSAVNQVLLANEPITVEFSEAIDLDSLRLNNARFDISQVNVTPNGSNSAVTLTPKDVWPGGEFQFTVKADDLAGNTVESDTFTTIVNLSFDNFSTAAVELGQEEVVVEEESTLTPFLSDSFANQLVHDGQLWIADYGDSAIHIFNTIPTQSHTAPDQQITSIEFIDDEGEITSAELNGPQAPFIFNNQLIVTLYDAHQVVIFDEIPTPGQNNFGIVLGQSDFTDTASSCAAVGLNNPEMATVAGGKLVVADSDNHRVLIWNTVPTISGTPPDLVLGQNSFDTCTENDDDQDGADEDLPTARTLGSASGVWSDGEKLIVNDHSNNRLVIWNTFPTENFSQADLVLGQPDFASNDSNNDVDELGEQTASARTLSNPYEGVHSNGRQIFVTDTNNHRVLVWNEWPTENFEAADAVLGQSNFVNTEFNDDDQNGVADTEEREEGEEVQPPSLRTMEEPSGILVFDNQVFVTDTGNSRVLIFNSK